jgi:hypothetical protein
MASLLINTNRKRALCAIQLTPEITKYIDSIKEHVYGRKSKMQSISKIEKGYNIVFDPIINKISEVFIDTNKDIFDYVSIVILSDTARINQFCSLSIFESSCTIIDLPFVELNAPEYDWVRIKSNVDISNSPLLSNQIIKQLVEITLEPKVDKKSLDEIIEISESPYESYSPMNLSNYLFHLQLHSLSLNDINDVMREYSELKDIGLGCSTCKIVTDMLYDITNGNRLNITEYLSTSVSEILAITFKQAEMNTKANVKIDDELPHVEKDVRAKEPSLGNLRNSSLYMYKEMFYLMFDRLDKNYLYVYLVDSSIPNWDDICFVNDLKRIDKNSINLSTYFKNMFRNGKADSSIIIDTIHRQGMF